MRQLLSLKDRSSHNRMNKDLPLKACQKAFLSSAPSIGPRGLGIGNNKNRSFSDKLNPNCRIESLNRLRVCRGKALATRIENSDRPVKRIVPPLLEEKITPKCSRDLIYDTTTPMIEGADTSTQAAKAVWFQLRVVHFFLRDWLGLQCGQSHLLIYMFSVSRGKKRGRVIGIRGILLNRRNIPIMSMPIESMLLAVNSNFLVFSVSSDDMMGQSFASLVSTVAAAESAIGLAIFVITFRVRGTIAVEFINSIQGSGPFSLGERIRLIRKSFPKPLPVQLLKDR
ncbi:hypothetical protein JHK85_058312 (mitochondrion) [Glycine max]|nr:hypothetical protein JHK85_058312 [Glycine max]